MAHGVSSLRRSARIGSPNALTQSPSPRRPAKSGRGSSRLGALQRPVKPQLPGLESTQVKPETSRSRRSTQPKNRVAKKALPKPLLPRKSNKTQGKHDASGADIGGSNPGSTPEPPKQVESSRLLNLPRELLHKIFGYNVRSQCVEETEKLGLDPLSSTSVIKQVCKDVVYEHEFLKTPPYGPKDRFLETPVDMQLVSKAFSYEYYETARLIAFTRGSVIHTTVADLNFDFVTAFLAGLEDPQVTKINTKQVKFIVRLEHEGFTWHKLILTSLRAFNKIVSDKFQVEGDAGESDDIVPLINHNINFEMLPMGGSKRNFVAKLNEWLDEFPDDMGLLKPFYDRWQKEHSAEAQ